MAKKVAKVGTTAEAAATVKAPTRKKHDRTIKPTEAEILERGRKLAAAYLTQRDGMPEEVSLAVISGMSADEVNALIEEANTEVIERLPKPEPEKFRNWLEIDGLPAVTAEDEDGTPLNIHDWTILTVSASLAKNRAEVEYKAAKKKVIEIMATAKVQSVECGGNKMERYTGSTSTLDAYLLAEAGVDTKIINKCYKTTEYDDVHITVPKEAKV